MAGIEKVIDRQGAKDRKRIVDIGMNTFVTYTNKHSVDCKGLWASREALIWQPLRYVIKPIPHTYYTYAVSSLPMGKEAIRRLKRKQERKQLQTI